MLTANDLSQPGNELTLIENEPAVEALVDEMYGVEVRVIVERVLWNLQTSNRRVERRRTQRHAYPYPLRIWPERACRMSKDGSIVTVGEGTVVMGKHISTGGLDFYSTGPITDRKVVVCLDVVDVPPTTQVLVELTWCRFGGHGMYLNGGRFLHALEEQAMAPSPEGEP